MTDFPQAKVFIETGFGNGATLRNAVNQPFEAIHSIEIDRTLFEAGEHEFMGHGHVTLHCGDSRAVLPHIITPAKTTAFWLDAHWSGGNFGESTPGDECPLTGELEIIADADWKQKPLIMVDDADFFNGLWWTTHPEGEPYHENAWPTLDEIRDLLQDYEVHDWAGVLVCVPPGYSGRVTVAGRQFP